MWHHPKYYKELRKRNRDLSELQQVKLERSVPQSDQVISETTATANGERAPGPGLKLQAREDSTANSTRGQVAEPQASSAKLTKHQAASVKPCGTSIKLQAASVKLQDS